MRKPEEIKKYISSLSTEEIKRIRKEFVKWMVTGLIDYPTFLAQTPEVSREIKKILGWTEKDTEMANRLAEKYQKEKKEEGKTSKEVLQELSTELEERLKEVKK